MTNPSEKIQLPSILKVIRPLLFLIIPIITIILAEFFVADYSEVAAKWIKIGSYVFIGVIVLWVLFRFVLFLRLYFTLKKRSLEMQRHDPLFIIEMKMQERIKKVHEKLKQTGKTPYDVPFYAVISDEHADVEAFLNGSSVVFPKDLEEDVDVADEYETWYVGNEAVFVDVSRLLSGRLEKEWLIFLKSLLAQRWNAPINGALVVLSQEHMNAGDSQERVTFEVIVQKKLQIMQEKLKEKFPAYMVVSRIDEIEGFNDFFLSMSSRYRGQMLGWSNPDPLESRLDLARFGGELKRIGKNLRSYLVERLNAQDDTENSDEIYNFVNQMEKLLGAVKVSTTRIFDPNNYLDPVPFRGVYMTGGLYAGDFTPASSANATMIGDGADIGVANATMIGDGNNINQFVRHQNWFALDFVSTKLLGESGNIGRPKWILKKQRRILIGGIVALSLQLVLSIGLMVSEVMSTADWREESQVVLTEAKEILDRPLYKKSHEKDLQDAKDVLEEINRLKQILENEELFQGSTSLGRRSEVLDGLNTIHDAVFQKYFLRDLIKEVEMEISTWDHQKKPFRNMGNKLIEYIKWANPHNKDELDINPFLDWSSEVEAVKERQFMLRHYTYDESAPKPQIVDKIAAKRIIKFFTKINGTDRVVLPLQSGGVSRNPGESEWEWWQRLSTGVDGVFDQMARNIKVKPSSSDGARSDPSNQIYDMVQSVEEFVKELEALDKLAKEGAKKFPYWISSVDNFFARAEKNSQNWPVVKKALAKSKDRDEFAIKKIVVPILDNRMHLVQLFIEQTSGVFKKKLDAFAQKKTTMSSDKMELYRSIGTKVMRIHKNFHVYLKGIQGLIEKSGALVSDSSYLKEEEILKKLKAMRTEAEIVAKKEAELIGLLKQTDELIKENNNGGEEEGEKDLKKAAKAKAKSAAKDALSDAMSGKAIKLEVLDKYGWKATSSWVKKWKKVLGKERTYLVAMYWMELFDWYRPIPKSSTKRSWQAVMHLGPLGEGGEMLFTEGIDDFLEQWLGSVPSETVGLITDESKQPPANIKNFADLYGQVKKFRSNYMPGLRKATNAFVKTVKSLNSGAYENWRKLSESEDGDISWFALESYSRFREEYEISEGINMRNITGSLLGMQTTIVNGLQQQLFADFNSRWKTIKKKASGRNLIRKFPFSRSGKSAEQGAAMELLEQSIKLGESYGVLAVEGQEDGKKLSEQSKSAVDKVVSSNRRRFIERSRSFRDFLRGNDEELPYVTIRVTSRGIGKHYHWIRMTVGSSNYFDMGVYGEKSVRVDLVSNYGNVRFEGLDINKVTRGDRLVAQGDFGLLKLLYDHGKSVNESRTKWIVTTQISASDADGEQVAFDMEFIFNQSVPRLPVFPN